MMLGRLVLSALGLLFFSMPLSAGQDTDGNTQDQNSPGPFNVAVDMQYELRIPAVLYFRVGSLGSVVDTVTFDLGATAYPPANNAPYSGASLPGDGTPIAATTNGVLPVEVRSNAGPISISATVSNPSGLSDGGGNFISFDEITTTSDSSDLPAPVLSNAGATPVNVTANQFAGLVTQQTANWTYSYDNTGDVSAGTYTGTVTYIASSP